MHESDSTSQFARSFSWIAWIVAIALLVLLFGDLLEQQWNPNQQPESHVDHQGRGLVVLEQNRQGHYLSKGRINGYLVTFLLDTGATQVSVPEHIAAQINLPKYNNYLVQTANGSVRVTRTRIDELSIGNIVLKDVDAHINPGMRADEILLGMSALKRVEFTQSKNQLILREQ